MWPKKSSVWVVWMLAVLMLIAPSVTAYAQEPVENPVDSMAVPGPDATLASGDGVPIVYYDFESDSNRTLFENAVDQQINTGNSALTRVGSPTAIRDRLSDIMVS